MTKPAHVRLTAILLLAAVAGASGIITAIVPQAVAPAFKIGNSTKFQLGAAGAVAGDCASYDVNLNITGPGTGAGCGVAATAKTLYYAPAAKTINGVGASVYQCSSSCGVPTAIATGTTVTASLHAAIPTTLTTSSFWDQWAIPAGYANQAITVEVMFRSADSSHTGSITVTAGQVASGGDIANPTLSSSTGSITLTPTAATGLTIATGTFTPSWTVGNLAMWKGVASIGSLTSDLEIISVRFYATF